MLKYLLIGILSFFSVKISNAQGEEEKKILKSMKLNYTPPKNFKTYLPYVECFEQNPKLWELMSCTSNGLISDDEEFISYMPIFRIMTMQDCIDINNMFPGKNISPNIMHVGNLRNQIRVLYGNEAKAKWRDYVEYWPSKKAEEVFNADTVVTYSAKLEKDDIFKGKYNHFGVLYLQKKDRGYVSYSFLFTEKANKRLKHYLDLIEATYRYDD